MSGFGFNDLLSGPLLFLIILIFYVFPDLIFDLADGDGSQCFSASSSNY